MRKTGINRRGVSSGEFEADNFIFNEWAKVTDRVQKVSTSIDVGEICICMSKHWKDISMLSGFKTTVLIIQKQILNQTRKYFYKWTSENYVNKDQAQIQSAYFGQRSFSILTACCYLNVDGAIVNENIAITSGANDHSRSAAMSCWMRVLWKSMI